MGQQENATIEGLSDGDRFARTCVALELAGIEGGGDRDHLFAALASLLHLSRVVFTDRETSGGEMQAEVASEATSSLAAAASQLGVPPQDSVLSTWEGGSPPTTLLSLSPQRAVW